YCVFYRSVSTLLHIIYHDVVNHKMLIEHFSCRQRKIGHVVKRMCSFFPQPFIHLITPECFVPVGNKKITNIIFAQFTYVFLLSYHFAKLLNKCGMFRLSFIVGKLPFLIPNCSVTVFRNAFQVPVLVMNQLLEYTAETFPQYYDLLLPLVKQSEFFRKSLMQSCVVRYDC